MPWALLLFLAGVNSQAALTQPASVSVSLGPTTKLFCSRSGGSSWGSFGWYQQKPGQGPRLVWYGSTEDEAVYYCGTRESSQFRSSRSEWRTETKMSTGAAVPSVSLSALNKIPNGH
uniref:Ig-like domain-containing protein n=1 Tax=Salvator merianae TaxID=96440 RepID=A0A8D0C5Q5_SALMN